MTSNMRRFVVSAGVGALLGIALGAIIASAYFNRTHERLLALKFSSEASEAKLLVRQMELLREGDVNKTISVLESLLDSTLTQMAFLKEQLPSITPDASDQEAISYVRSYRSQHPSLNPNETVGDLSGRILSVPANSSH